MTNVKEAIDYLVSGRFTGPDGTTPYIIKACKGVSLVGLLMSNAMQYKKLNIILVYIVHGFYTKKLFQRAFHLCQDRSMFGCF